MSLKAYKASGKDVSDLSLTFCVTHNNFGRCLPSYTPPSFPADGRSYRACR